MLPPQSGTERVKPTLILHGGAGAITRSYLPPSLYTQYHRSLLSYLTSTASLLNGGTDALDAAVHAVSLMEDDELFNCGRGSVFNLDGEIEMEASVMVASICPDDEHIIGTGLTEKAASERGRHMGGFRKRAAAVSLVQQTRHPIQLAREVLVEGDGNGVEVRDMHCHLSGRQVEEWGWARGMEKRPKDWFFTERRRQEHKKGLKKEHAEKVVECLRDQFDGMTLPSQGTVGAVCLDQWGNLAVATSTGGLTNKKPGRIGDTPTVGAGFWAESWEATEQEGQEPRNEDLLATENYSIDWLYHCFPPGLTHAFRYTPTAYQPLRPPTDLNLDRMLAYRPPSSMSISTPPRRAVAMSGTGNGDSFLRTNAARSAAARSRYGRRRTPLATAVTAIAGPGGELQQSAGGRFGSTGEGEGGLIGIEASSDGSSNVVFDFNCGGMWRAYYELADGKEKPKVMVFRDEYR